MSTLDQDLEQNKANILHFANYHDLGKVNFVEEVAFERKPWRERQIVRVLEELQDSDAITRKRCASKKNRDACSVGPKGWVKASWILSDRKSKAYFGKRIDPTVYRTALPHDRSESPQLAQEEWDEDTQSLNVIVSNNEKKPRERVNLVMIYALSPLKIL